MKKLFAVFFGFAFCLIPVASAYALSPSLSSGLVSYWKLDGNAVDSVGANTLTNENGTTFVPAKLHSGANMLSVSQQDFVITNSAQAGLNFASGAPFSMSIWVKPTLDSANSFDKDFIAKTNGTAGAGYMLSIENGGRPFCRVAMDTPAGRLGVSNAYNDHAYHADTEIDDGNWHHVACVYDGTILSLYVDGALWADRNVGAKNNTSAENFYIGFHAGGNIHDHFDGQLDEVGVWGRALSGSEVTDLYASYANTAPVAGGATLSTNEDTALPITLPGSDADGDALAFATSTSPAHGTLSVLVGSTTIYTPDPNYNGTDSFTYLVGDGLATTSPATVTITVSPVNDAPILAPISSQTATSGDAVTFTATSTDIDGGAPVYSIASSSATTTATINPTTGVFSWATGGAPAGVYVFAVSVSDGATSTATTATITLVAAPPPATPVSAPVSAPAVDPRINEGSGVAGAGPLSVGYQTPPANQNNPTSTPKTSPKTSTTLPATKTPTENQNVATPPAPTAAPASAPNTPNPNTPNTATGQPQNSKTVVLPSVSPENLLTNTPPTNQLASIASSGFKLPLWLCGAGGLFAAGAAAWWWLGLAL